MLHIEAFSSSFLRELQCFPKKEQKNLEQQKNSNLCVSIILSRGCIFGAILVELLKTQTNETVF